MVEIHGPDDADAPCADSDSEETLILDRRKAKGNGAACMAAEPGPASYGEMFGWADYFATKILEKLEEKNIETSKKLRIQLTTSYSGSGMAEVAAACVKQALLKRSFQVEILVRSQTEYESTYQAFLHGHHVYGDLKDRVHKDLWNDLVRLQASIREKAEAKEHEMKSKSKQGKTNRKEIAQAFEREFFDKATALLRDSPEHFKNQTKCTTHKEGDCSAACSWAPCEQDLLQSHEGEVAVWIEIAGNTCCPWSNRGAMRGFLDEENLPAMIWGWSMKHNGYVPDIIINENVLGWPAETFFQSIFKHDIKWMESFCFSPADLGIPMNRPRKYTIVCLSDLVVNPFARQGRAGPIYSFAEIAYRTPVCPGSVFLCAPQEEVAKLTSRMAIARHLPPQRMSGKPWQTLAVMGSGYRERASQFLAEWMGSPSMWTETTLLTWPRMWDGQSP